MPEQKAHYFDLNQGPLYALLCLGGRLTSPLVTADAVRDLEEIYRYIAEDNINAAIEHRQRLKQRCLGLVDHHRPQILKISRLVRPMTATRLSNFLLLVPPQAVAALPELLAAGALAQLCLKGDTQ